MTNKIQIFSNKSFGEVRTTIGIDGNPKFSLLDICNILGLQTNKVQQRLSPKGMEYYTTPTKGGKQNMIFVSEPNLYRCIFQSRKKEAEQFQDWVFEEVLPSIRNNGGYLTNQQGTDKESFDQAVAERSNVIVASQLKELNFWRSVANDQNKIISELKEQLYQLGY